MSNPSTYVFDAKYVADTDGFTFDLTAWLGSADQLTQTPSATVSPSTASIVAVALTGAVVTVWVSGGTAGTTCTIEIEVRTALGRDCRIRGTVLVVS
jgi:hypothetical protein